LGHPALSVRLVFHPIFPRAWGEIVARYLRAIGKTDGSRTRLDRTVKNATERGVVVLQVSDRLFDQ
jgi:hypothetical protein